MTKEERKQWDMWAKALMKQSVFAPGDELLIKVNAHILKLERTIKNLKDKGPGHRIAALLQKQQKED